MPSSKTYFVKVLNIEEKTFLPVANTDSQPDASFYKKVELIEEVGWWINRFYINLFQNHHLYADLKDGDKLFLRVRH